MVISPLSEMFIEMQINPDLQDYSMSKTTDILLILVAHYCFYGKRKK